MDGPAPLPKFWEVRAPEAWRCIDFISDLHLSEHTPRTLAAFEGHLRSTPADAVFILGDLFDVWVGDDARFEGFEAQCVDVLAEAAARRTVGFMAGNRDFLVGGELLRACGAVAMSDPAVLVAFGERLLVTHGDLLCIADRDYQQFRRMVRSESWQSVFLSRELAERRRAGSEMRQESERRKANQMAQEWIDVDTATAVRWMHEAGTPTLVHGHTHRPGSEALAPGYVRHVLSDWDLDGAHGPARAEVLRWKASGLQRVAPSAAG
jgi:UDP-2,3-diacylglucosamine hydrolase